MKRLVLTSLIFIISFGVIKAQSSSGELEFDTKNSEKRFSFSINRSLGIDASVEHIKTPRYVELGDVVIKAVIKNLGSSTITSLDFNYSINNGSTITQSLVLNFASFDEYQLTHIIPWTPATSGDYFLKVWISNVNGQVMDDNSSNDNQSKLITVRDSKPNIMSSYALATNTFDFEVIGTATNQVLKPRDLDFDNDGELWVINQGTENSGGSTVTFTNPGETNQSSVKKQDSNAWHFMSLPTGIAFSENGNFATSTGVFDANHNGGSAFTGPTLWSSDPNIYAQPSGGNGSHLDMLHESPYSMGIAHEIDNVFWVFDANSNDIVRYDFVDDHGPGNAYHGDAIVRRYPEIYVDWINEDIPCHLVLNKNTGMLYIVDGGSQRILRLDINSGTIGGTPSYGPHETMAEYTNVTGTDWEVVVNSGSSQPSGIDVLGDNLIVSDYSNGDIIIYDFTTIPATEVNRIQTNEPGVMGVVIGPEGRIWYVNYLTNEVRKIEPDSIVIPQVTTIKELNDNILLTVYPNPSNGIIQIELAETNFNNPFVTIINVVGEEVLSFYPNSNADLTLDVTSLTAGMYYIIVKDGVKTYSSKVVLSK